MDIETTAHIGYLEKCLELINNLTVSFHETGPHNEKEVVEFIMNINTLSDINDCIMKDKITKALDLQTAKHSLIKHNEIEESCLCVCPNCKSRVIKNYELTTQFYSDGWFCKICGQKLIL